MSDINTDIHIKKIDTGYNAGHSRFVKRMRFALPVLALVIGAVVFSWGFIDREKLAPPPSDEAPKATPKSALVAPNFQSVDEKGRPFSITATAAAQDETNPDIVSLDAPTATMNMNDTRTITLTARGGAYNQTTRQLSLRDDIIVKTTDGYTISGAGLSVDFSAGSAVSDTIITGTGDSGTLFAHGLRVDTSTDIFTLMGPAKLTLTGAAGSGLF